MSEVLLRRRSHSGVLRVWDAVTFGGALGGALVMVGVLLLLMGVVGGVGCGGGGGGGWGGDAGGAGVWVGVFDVEQLESGEAAVWGDAGDFWDAGDVIDRVVVGDADIDWVGGFFGEVGAEGEGA